MNVRFADRLWQSQRTPLHTRRSNGLPSCDHLCTVFMVSLSGNWSECGEAHHQITKGDPISFKVMGNLMIVLDMLSMLSGLGFATSSRRQSVPWGTANRFWKTHRFAFSPRFYPMGWGLRKDPLNNVCPNALARRTFKGRLPFLALESATHWNSIV